MIRSIIQWTLPIITYFVILTYVYKTNHDDQHYLKYVSWRNALGTIILSHILMGIAILIIGAIIISLIMFFTWLY